MASHSTRDYPAGVSLLRRCHLPAEPGSQTDAEAISHWLLGDASRATDMIGLIEGFVSLLAQAGLGVSRLSLNVGTLHPQALGYAWNWSSTDGFCDEIQIREEVLRTDAYMKNPLYRAMEYGEIVKVPLHRPGPMAESKLLQALRHEGFTEYLAIPLSASGERFNAVTLATRQPGGFADSQIRELDQLLKLFSLHVDRHIAIKITENISHTYLGREAGSKVVKGTIKRGTGVVVDAIVWQSDMRDYSRIADTLDSQTLAALLDSYFSVMAEAVTAHGGDVLKFIGDGMLAIFPVKDFGGRRGAARAARRAAREAIRQLQETNETDLPRQGLSPLQSGIGLHAGEVYFGNIGASRRLDFTVIGEAVNIASRIESLCKPLQRSILVSEEVANLLEPLPEPMGPHVLKGTRTPQRLFALHP